MQDDCVNSAFEHPSQCPVLVWDNDSVRSDRILEALAGVRSAAVRRADLLEQLVAVTKGTVVVLALSSDMLSDALSASGLMLFRELECPFL